MKFEDATGKFVYHIMENILSSLVYLTVRRMCVTVGNSVLLCQTVQRTLDSSVTVSLLTPFY
jgi:hypothetical protein